ncbi:MAG TPA: hypothetical protein VJQ54_05910, partial [Candidatus Sulfotelmatobacter sp.]|nr:hypothetical protein [Candidatus Sulfotelmatobacter sp.]
AASPVGDGRSVRTIAQQQANYHGSGCVKPTAKAKSFQEEKRQKPKPSSGDCVNGLARVPLSESGAKGR